MGRGFAGRTDALGEALARRLALASAPVCGLVEALTSERAATRLAALDRVHGALLDEGEVTADAPELLAYLVRLGTSPRYPEASAVLVRLTGLLAAIDAPPRSLAGAGGTEARRRAYDVVGAHLDALLRVVRSSSNPEASRIAACLCARFPAADAEVAPLLIALLSGARDANERGRLLYALTRVQASRGAALHGRVADALHAEGTTPQKLAVMLALAEHDPPEPLRSRAVRVLREARDADPAFADPTAWGRRLPEATVDRLVARLAPRR